MRPATAALAVAHGLNLLGLAAVSAPTSRATGPGEWSSMMAAVFEHGRVGRWLIAALLAGCAGVAALHTPHGRRWWSWAAVFGCASLLTAVIELPSTVSPIAVVHVQLAQMTMAALVLGALLHSAERCRVQIDGAALRPGRIAAVVLAGLGVVCVTGLGASTADMSSAAAGLFDLDGEGNVPSWFSSALLGAAAVACALMTPFDRRRAVRRLWIVLAVLFTAVSFDEYASLHELPVVAFIERQNLGWILTLSWAALLTAVAAVVALLCISGLLRLRRRTARRMIACGCVYLSGAIGLELFGGWWFDAHGGGTLHTILVASEEMLEMSGIAAFILVVCAELRASETCCVIGRPGRDEPATYAIERAVGAQHPRAA